MKRLKKESFVIFLMSLIIIAGCGGGGGGGVDNDTPINTTPPPVPAGLTATTVSASRIDLSWNASTDAVGYNLYRNGTFLANVYGATTYSHLNLVANTTYSYTATAYNSNGNESSQCTSVSAKTLGTATKLLGTSSNDYGRGVAIDSNGNVYVTGWTGGTLDGLANPNNADIFLTKYTSAGDKVFTRLLGTTGVVEPNPDGGIDLANYGLNIAVDSTRGFVYVTGYTTANMGGQVHSNPGVRNTFLFRCKLDGTQPQTAALFGGSQDNAGNAVAVDINGNVYVAGYTGGASGKDILLLKYDSSLGFPIYRMTGSVGNGDDVATGVAVSEDGSAVFLTGVTGGVLPLNLLTAGYSGGGDLFIAKFDAVPNLQWTTYLGSLAMDAGMAITVRGGSVKVAGVTQGVLPGKTSAGGGDIIVASYNASSGAVHWTTQFGSTADEVAYGIVVDSIGNSYLTGFTSGSPSPLSPNAGLEDLFMARLSIGGTVFSVNLAGTTSADEGRAIAIRESDNIVYVVGSTSGNLDGESNSGGFDMGLLKFNLAGEKQ